VISRSHNKTRNQPSVQRDQTLAYTSTTGQTRCSKKIRTGRSRQNADVSTVSASSTASYLADTTKNRAGHEPIDRVTPRRLHQLHIRPSPPHSRAQEWILAQACLLAHLPFAARLGHGPARPTPNRHTRWRSTGPQPNTQAIPVALMRLAFAYHRQTLVPRTAAAQAGPRNRRIGIQHTTKTETLNPVPRINLITATPELRTAHQRLAWAGRKTQPVRDTVSYRFSGTKTTRVTRGGKHYYRRVFCHQKLCHSNLSLDPLRAISDRAGCHEGRDFSQEVKTSARTLYTRFRRCIRPRLPVAAEHLKDHAQPPTSG